MLRRDFIKVIGTIGAIATLPSDAIAQVKTYPKIKYEVDYIPEKLCYLHSTYGETNNERWVVFEYADDKVLTDDLFLSMVDKLNEKIMFMV